MTLDEFEAAHDSGGPIDMLEAYYHAHSWVHERVGEDEIVATMDGSWTKYELRAVWREDDRVLQFLAMPDIKTPIEKRADVYEALGLINEQLWLGHFELWSSSGIVLFRHAVLLDGQEDCQLSLEQAELLVETAIDECERFYPVFQFVLWGGKTPAEAISAAMIETRGEA